MGLLRGGVNLTSPIPSWRLPKKEAFREGGEVSSFWDRPAPYPAIPEHGRRLVPSR